MYFLVIDTSGKQGSIALAHGKDTACEMLDMADLEGGTFSAQLVPQISALLTKHGLRKEDIGAFVVVSGPGSFTGLRIGLAAAKGLAEILHTPIAEVSLLDALAESLAKPGHITTAMDAGRGEFYVGTYEFQGSLRKMTEDRVIKRDELLQMAAGRILITPDPGFVAMAREKGIDAREVVRPRSDLIARLGWKKIYSGQITSVEALDAGYIRRAVDPA